MLFYGLIVALIVAVVVGLREYRRIAREVPSAPAQKAPILTPPPARPCTLPVDRPAVSRSDRRLHAQGPVHDVDPVDAEWAGFPWFDDRSCWGCDRECSRRAFRPYAGTNIGAEIRGAGASQARARADEPYSCDVVTPHHGQNGGRRSTSVDALWDASCEECGRLVRRVEAGWEPVPGSTVAVESGTAMETPF